MLFVIWYCFSISIVKMGWWYYQQWYISCE